MVNHEGYGGEVKTHKSLQDGILFKLIQFIIFSGKLQGGSLQKLYQNIRKKEGNINLYLKQCGKYGSLEWTIELKGA